MLKTGKFDETLSIKFNRADHQPANRKVLKRTSSNPEKWDEIWFCDIKRGDYIRLKDPDGQPVIHEDGREIFVALSDAYLDDYGYLCFDI